MESKIGGRSPGGFVMEDSVGGSRLPSSPVRGTSVFGRGGKSVIIGGSGVFGIVTVWISWSDRWVGKGKVLTVWRVGYGTWYLITGWCCDRKFFLFVSWSV